MNINGIYNIYKNNELIATSPNLITNNGKSIILQYLANSVADWSSFIATGAFGTAASVSDYKLYYEIARVPILTKFPVDSISLSVTSSGTINSTSITVSSSSGISLGYSVSGTGVTSSATVTTTKINGNTIVLSHPIETTFSASSLTFNSAKSIKFRSRIPQGIECIIYELGMFNGSNLTNETSFDGKILTNFSEDISFGSWSSGSSVSSASTAYYPRLGTSLLKLNSTFSSSALAIYGDSSSSIVSTGNLNSNYGILSVETVRYSSSYDTGKLVVYSSASGASVTIVGQDNTTGTTTNNVTIIQKTAIPAGGPWIIETPIIKNSTYNDVLSKFEVRVTSASPVDVYLDSLKFSQTESVSVFSGLVSRSVLSTPIQKAAEEEIEIEYEIFLFP